MRKVLERFEAKAVWSNLHIFRVNYEYAQESFQNAIWDMGQYLNLPADDLVSEMRSALAIRDVMLRRERPQSAEALWSSVLVGIQDRKDLPLAERLVASFLLAPSQAAECERGFSTIVRLRERLGHECSPSVLEQYLQVGSLGRPLQEAMSGGCIKAVTQKFLGAKDRRLASAGDLGWYRRGRRMVKRKRKERADSGKKRASYKKRKKHAGLRDLGNARHLARGTGEAVELAEGPDDVPEHPIWEQMSPRKAR
ncbi:unnamed protein product [Effrenium voratum]|nr:unnamed protein product [Effrenium voratum]